MIELRPSTVIFYRSLADVMTQKFHIILFAESYFEPKGFHFLQSKCLSGILYNNPLRGSYTHNSKLVVRIAVKRGMGHANALS